VGRFVSTVELYVPSPPVPVQALKLPLSKPSLNKVLALAIWMAVNAKNNDAKSIKMIDKQEILFFTEIVIIIIQPLLLIEN
jgi:hypothetical protein